MAFQHTEESKRRLSEMRRGANNPFFGKKHSPETLARMAEATRAFNLTTRRYEISPRQIPELSLADRAYLAGLIDGEGSIVLPRGRKQTTVCVYNTSKPLMAWLQETVGGSVARVKKATEREPCMQWYVAAARDVAALIVMVRPHLIIKADRADKALSFLQDKYGDLLNG